MEDAPLHQVPRGLVPAPHLAIVEFLSHPELQMSSHQGVTFYPPKDVSLGSLEGKVLCGSHGGNEPEQRLQTHDRPCPHPCSSGLKETIVFEILSLTFLVWLQGKQWLL